MEGDSLDYAFFAIEPESHIDINHIADITYTPAGSLPVHVTYDPADQREIERSPPSPSYLNIELKSGEVIPLACTLCASMVQADPSPSVRYLMGESVSMFEWGIFRLEARAERCMWDGLDIKHQFACVEYDWPKNNELNW